MIARELKRAAVGGAYVAATAGATHLVCVAWGTPAARAAAVAAVVAAGCWCIGVLVEPDADRWLRRLGWRARHWGRALKRLGRGLRDVITSGTL